MTVNDSSDRTLTITRLIDAPRDLIWRAMSEPEHLIHWWGPNGFTNTFYEFEMKPGGVWRFMMHGPDGTDYPNKIVFREIVDAQRLVYDHSDDGGGKEGIDHAFLGTITLDDEDGKTRVTLSIVFETAKEFEDAKKFGADTGGNQTLGRLADYVAAMQ